MGLSMSDAPNRPQTTYDLPLEYKEAVRQLAKRLNTSNSQTVQLLIFQALETLDNEIWTLNSVQRVRSLTNRFRWDLKLPELPDYDFDDYELDNDT
jgi:hypothetical protein